MGSNSGKTGVIVLVVLLAILGVAYFFVGVQAQAEIDAAWAARQAEKKPIIKEVVDEPNSEGPFHLAIRYGNATLAKLVEESVSKRMEGGPPTSDMGGMGDKVKVSPLTVTAAKAAFPEDASGIMLTTVDLKGTMTVTLNQRIRRLRSNATNNVVPIYPRATVRVKMESEIVEGRPSMVVKMLGVDSFSLNAKSNIPLPAAIQNKIRESIRQKIEARLTDPNSTESERIMALPEKLGKGDIPLKIVDAGLTIVPGADGEMFLGFKTNLNAEPQITAENRGAPLGEHSWGLTLGDNTLSIMMGAMADQGRLPSRFNRKGEPAEGGPIVFDIESAELTDEGFILSSRIWNLAFPAFWRHFDVHGKMTLKEGSMAPEILKMVGGEGGGNTWLGEIIEGRLQEAPKSSMKKGGKSVPPQMPLPMSGGSRALQLNIERVVTGPHYMTVSGTSEVVDAAPAP